MKFRLSLKKYTGQTHFDYLIEMRIVRAKLLLEPTDMTVEEIMWLIGYHNKGFFYCNFRKYAGMNPSQYRRNSR